METMSHAVLDLALEPDDLAPEDVLEGRPSTSVLVLDRSPDGRITRGVWEITPGVVRDTEADELFVVVCGRATVELEDGRTLELGPGVVGGFREGERTVWRVHERLRKVFQTSAQRCVASGTMEATMHLQDPALRAPSRGLRS